MEFLQKLSIIKPLSKGERVQGDYDLVILGEESTVEVGDNCKVVVSRYSKVKGGKNVHVICTGVGTIVDIESGIVESKHNNLVRIGSEFFCEGRIDFCGYNIIIKEDKLYLKKGLKLMPVAMEQLMRMTKK